MLKAPSGYGATLSVDALNHQDAIVDATRVFLEAATRCALPPWPLAVVEAVTFDEQDRRLAEPAFPELVGVGELAAILGVSRQRASDIQSKPGFPEPVAVLRAGPVWTRPSVQRFLDEWERKPGRPRKTGTTGATARTARALRSPQYPTC